ncbi:unnamed protein product [Eruca vesicaria subsp. sativa]|uniref:ABC-2 type transporter transmembrane domain-containing protein n=1 Tax=Eruca vesicaria subsp. sativa TaxID=29727 RepID=A0ABC8J9W9_ERUVS|nr:unnamed protein product [Eruca vesicaria subsp. sativa]
MNNFSGVMYALILFLGATKRPVLPLRELFYSEKAAGMYSTIPYVIPQVYMEIMYNTIRTGVYTLIPYSMIE